jgi:hypothetical protein
MWTVLIFHCVFYFLRSVLILDNGIDREFDLSVKSVNGALQFYFPPFVLTQLLLPQTPIID